MSVWQTSENIAVAIRDALLPVGYRLGNMDFDLPAYYCAGMYASDGQALLMRDLLFLKDGHVSIAMRTNEMKTHVVLYFNRTTPYTDPSRHSNENYAAFCAIKLGSGICSGTVTYDHVTHQARIQVGRSQAATTYGTASVDPYGGGDFVWDAGAMPGSSAVLRIMTSVGDPSGANVIVSGPL